MFFSVKEVMNMKKIISNRKAEGYIDIAVGIIALMMVLVVTLNIYTFFMLRQTLHRRSLLRLPFR